MQGAGGAHGAALRGIQYQYRWIGRVRRSCGTASDAIFANSGPSGPGEHADRHSDFTATQILRAGNDALTARRASPVMGVQGAGEYGREAPI